MHVPDLIACLRSATPGQLAELRDALGLHDHPAPLARAVHGVRRPMERRSFIADVPGDYAEPERLEDMGPYPHGPNPVE